MTSNGLTNCQTYISMASRDGLYGFANHGSFQDHLIKFLDHILLPLREYVCHFYPVPGQYSDLVVPNKKKNKYVEWKTFPIADLSASLSFRPILDGIHGGRPGKLSQWKAYETKMTFIVPRDGKHKFWSKKGLRLDDGKYENGVPITISAIGSSAADAEGAALLRLNTFLDDCREKLQSSSHSRVTYQSERESFDFKDGVAVQMARKLMETYQHVKSRGDESIGWKEISGALEKCLEEIHLDLIPLIKYYLVCNFLPLPHSYYPIL